MYEPMENGRCEHGPCCQCQYGSMDKGAFDEIDCDDHDCLLKYYYIGNKLRSVGGICEKCMKDFKN